MRVLTGDQQAVADDMNSPVRRFREDGTELQHLIFDKERYHLGEAYLFLFAVGKAGYFLALYEGLAVGRLDMTQRTGRMTHDGDCFAGSKEGLDQFD